MQYHLVHKCRCVYDTLLRLVDVEHFKAARRVAYLLPDVPARLPCTANGQLAGQFFGAGQSVGLILDCFALTALSLPGFKIRIIKRLEAAQFFVCQT